MNVRRNLLLALTALAAAAVASSSLTAQERESRRPVGGEDVLAIVGGEVHTGTGRVLRRGTVLCRDGKIEAVGVDLRIPEGANIVDATGKWVLPGFVAPQGNNFGIRRGRPRKGEKFSQCLEADSTYCELALSAGITAYVASGRSRSPYSDTNAVVKPAYLAPELMIVKEPAALDVRWAGQSGMTRASLRETLASARKWIRGGKKGRQPGSGTLIAALERKVPVRISASTKRDIRGALELAREYDLRLVLTNATEAWTMPEEIAAAGAIAIVQPRQRRWPRPGMEGESGSRIDAVATLEKAGASFCILPPGGFGGGGSGISLNGIAGRDLLTYPVEGAFAIRGGASRDAALRAITLTAAEAAGVEDRIGSLEAGKDADIVIYQGDPFDYRLMADVTIVSGRVLYEREKSTLFSHLPPR